jgi:hypothetical protein
MSSRIFEGDYVRPKIRRLAWANIRPGYTDEMTSYEEQPGVVDHITEDGLVWVDFDYDSFLYRPEWLDPVNEVLRGYVYPLPKEEALKKRRTGVSYVPDMTSYVGRRGLIIDRDDGLYLVRFSNGAEWWYLEEWLSKTKTCEINIDDIMDIVVKKKKSEKKRLLVFSVSGTKKHIGVLLPVKKKKIAKKAPVQKKVTGPWDTGLRGKVYWSSR